jgi:hypothetical protein
MLESGSAADAVTQTSATTISQADPVTASEIVSSLILAAGILAEPGAAADSLSAGLFATVTEPASAQDIQSLTLAQVGTLTESGAALDVLQPIINVGAQQIDTAPALDILFAGTAYVPVTLSESATAAEQMNSFLGPVEKSQVFLSGKLTNKVGLDGKMPRTVQLQGEAPFP